MILMNNVFLTNEVTGDVGKSYHRGNLPQEDKINIYKYALSSLANMYPWKKAIIYFSLDQPYIDREKELIEFIEKEYSHIKELIIRNKRNEYVRDWIDTYDLLNDELIYFCCNHDHVFVDNEIGYSLKYFNTFKHMHDCETDFSSVYFTHWPEMIAHMFCRGFNIVNIDGLDMAYFNTGQYPFIDSVQVLTNALYKEWWLNNLDKDLFLPRADYSRCIYQYKNIPSTKIFVPLKELSRHFDAYHHTLTPVSLNDCPALSIPDGFFDNDIKLSFGKKIEGYTYCDLSNPNYFCFNTDGADYKFDKLDIPFFWKNKISSIIEYPYDKDVNQCKKDNIINLLCGKTKQDANLSNQVSIIVNKVLNLYGIN